MPVRPSAGVCEVVCYSSKHDSTFAEMPLSQIRKLTRVWRDRYIDLGSRPEVEYVFIFENKGREIGVTLSHPHGQIYAYPFIPPTPTLELATEKAYLERTGRLVMADVLAENGDQIVCERGMFVAFVPKFARYPYEVYVTCREHRPSVGAMSDTELDDLAYVLLEMTRRYDALFGFSMPYIMAMHQAPTNGQHDYNWFHVEFYPPYRTATKLKYLAGSEAGMAAFINDTLPEVTAKTLRDLSVDMS